MHLPKADSQREKWDVTAGLGCCSPIGSSLQLSFVFYLLPVMGRLLLPALRTGWTGLSTSLRCARC